MATGGRPRKNTVMTVAGIRTGFMVRLMVDGVVGSMMELKGVRKDQLKITLTMLFAASTYP